LRQASEVRLLLVLKSVYFPELQKVTITMENNNNTPMTVSEFADTMIGLGLAAALVILCLQVFSPFIGLMLWAVILAVTLYPMHQALARRMGAREGRAATVIVLTGLLIIGVPLALLGTSLANHLADFYQSFQSDTILITPPSASVADWPVVGETVFKAWSDMSANLPEFIEENKAGLQDLLKRLISVSAGTMAGVLMFLGALIVAGIMMAYGQSGRAAMERIVSRFSGEGRGPAILTLSTLTVRSVAAGVLGVAFIQALILGIGFFFAGVPASGVLAIIVLFLGILQLPSFIITIPVIAWLWGTGDSSTVFNSVWSVYLIVGGFSDGILKPILLGRGVDAPMPVILIGALGGMISAGIIGLFVGAVLLAVGYRLLMEWVGRTSEAEVDES
jgi:predicted PurR-regulated permease PerM